MSQNDSLNLFDIDNLVIKFLKDKKQSISNLNRIWFKNTDQLSLQALIEELKDELRTGCVTFINKGYALDGLDAYLFYIVNAYCKNKASPKIKKKSEYICPGCLFVGKENLIFLRKFFYCDECEEEFKQAKDPKWIEFYSTFKRHNKSGYRCSDCKRFIPQPSAVIDMISCPYIDCGFAGEITSLKKMHHPTSDASIEVLSVDLVKDNGKSLKDNIVSESENALNELEKKENLQDQLNTIKSVIEYQSNNVPYSSSDFTVKHKQFVYAAFKNLLHQYPEDMIDYLINNSRTGGFQHKVFQEYIRLLDEALPMFVSKNKKLIKITSLLDNNLSLFDGLSVFDAVVTSKMEIKNNTQEFYIGNRKSSYTQPYYMGKLLNVINKDTNIPILDKVKEYSFLKIKLKDVKPGTNVTVSHLRVPPHYQMGGMVYVNRIRKKIVDRSLILLHK